MVVQVLLEATGDECSHGLDSLTAHVTVQHGQAPHRHHCLLIVTQHGQVAAMTAAFHSLSETAERLVEEVPSSPCGLNAHAFTSRSTARWVQHETTLPR